MVTPEKKKDMSLRKKRKKKLALKLQKEVTSDTFNSTHIVKVSRKVSLDFFYVYALVFRGKTENND